MFPISLPMGLVTMEVLANARTSEMHFCRIYLCKSIMSWDSQLHLNCAPIMRMRGELAYHLTSGQVFMYNILNLVVVQKS